MRLTCEQHPPGYPLWFYSVQGSRSHSSSTKAAFRHLWFLIWVSFASGIIEERILPSRSLPIPAADWAAGFSQPVPMYLKPFENDISVHADIFLPVSECPLLVKVFGGGAGGTDLTVNKLTCYLTFLINSGASGPPAEDCQLLYKVAFMTLGTQRAESSPWPEYWFHGGRTSVVRCSLFLKCPTCIRQDVVTLKQMKAVCHRCPWAPSLQVAALPPAVGKSVPTVMTAPTSPFVHRRDCGSPWGLSCGGKRQIGLCYLQASGGRFDF